MTIEGNKLKCPKCGYSWTSKSKLLKVSCPSCGTKVKNEVVNNDS